MPSLVRPLALLLCLSGAAALVLEGVWARWLSFALGAGAYGTTAVLAVFMGGLGAGALVGGRFASRRSAHGALRLLAVVEGTNAAWSVATIALLPSLLPEAAGALARLLGVEGLPLPIRLALATAALVVPTGLMGASLPLALRAATEAAGDRAARAGLLYAANTLGGAAGALFGATSLVELVGLSGAAGVAAALQVATGAGALLLARRAPRDSARTAPTPVAGRPVLATVAFAASGFAGLSLEVGAQRVLSLQLGSTISSFAGMLSAMLLGIAAGGAAAAALGRRVRPERALVLALAAVGAGAGYALVALDAESARGFREPFLAASAILLPSALALGAVATLVGRIVGGGPGEIPPRFAAAYAANAVASAAGALVGGLVLVPSLGASGTIRVAGLAAFAGAAAAIAAAPRAIGRTTAATAAGLAIAAAIASAGSDPVRDTYERWFGPEHVVAIREGPVQAVAVTQESTDQFLDYRRLVAHRTSLAATHLAARRYMRLLGHLPVALAESRRRALVICLGTGTTLQAVASHEELERIDVAEISPEVVDLVADVYPPGTASLADPRVRLHVEDGRHLLLSARDRWDVITLEPPPPSDAGVVSLYTEEFYALCRRRLSPGGVVAQWIPLQSQTLEDVRILVAAFARSFPHAAAFLPVERDLVLVGSQRPLARDASEWRDAVRGEAVRASLREIGYDSPEAILASAVAGRDELLRFSRGAPDLTDDRPLVERRATDRVPRHPDVTALRNAGGTLATLVRGTDPGFPRSVAEVREAYALLLAGEDARERGDAAESARLREAAWRRRPADAYLTWTARLSDAHLARFLADAKRRGDDPRAWASVGEKLLLRGEVAAARSAFTNALRTMPARDPAAVAIRAWLEGPG